MFHEHLHADLVLFDDVFFKCQNNLYYEIVSIKIKHLSSTHNEFTNGYDHSTLFIYPSIT